jgi:fumarylpyruvate hydrolase
VHRVYCVGRNYAEHAQEMGHTGREPPFFFLKPADTVVYVPDGQTGEIDYPTLTSNFHHEIELVVAIARGGRDIAVERATEHVFGYAVGVDLTRRDLQLAARDAGRPWEWGKAFDRSAPCAPIVRAAEIGHPSKGRIWLSVNGTVKQDADISQLIWSVPEVIAFVSASMALAPGDLIFTGTPAGVGPLVAGDVVEGGVDGIGTIGLRIGPSQG